MSTTVWIGAAVVAVIGLAAWLRRAGALERAVAAAIARGSVGDLEAVLLRRAAPTQPAAFNHAIRRLWDSYQRPLAAPLIRSLASRHADVPIAQYWLSQLQSVEPALAREHLDDDFVRAHYRPQVAAACGPVG